ncbi:MAG TPA: DUF5655 domain-containing protein [Terriglobales bacterium]|nr:DUF5655 domain-containing protein [Terriglobales bacterium]
MTPRKRPLWKCPRCGHRFVTRNMYHSCVRVKIADHFRGKDPLVRKLYGAYRALVQRCGPVTVYANKTGIVFQARVRFTGVTPKKHWLDGGFWFKRRVEHPRFYRIETIPPGDYIHRFRLTKLSDIDKELARFVRESYDVGCQKHLEGAQKPRP